jgi:hypothetical protein
MLSASQKGNLKNHQSESDFDQLSSTFCWCSVKYQRTMMPSSPNSISIIFFYAIFQQLWNLLLFSEGSNAKVYPQT